MPETVKSKNLETKSATMNMNSALNLIPSVSLKIKSLFWALKSKDSFKSVKAKPDKSKNGNKNTSNWNKSITNYNTSKKNPNVLVNYLKLKENRPMN